MDGWTDGQKNGQTDQVTNRESYRIAGMQLEISPNFICLSFFFLGCRFSSFISFLKLLDSLLDSLTAKTETFSISQKMFSQPSENEMRTTNGPLPSLCCTLIHFSWRIRKYRCKIQYLVVGQPMKLYGSTLAMTML